MRHMEKVREAAVAAMEVTKDNWADCWVDYEEPMGYRINIRWTYLRRTRGLSLVISEDQAGSEQYLRQYVIGNLLELIEAAKRK